MIKKIKKYGNTLVVSFTKEEQEVYNLKEGDLIQWIKDIDDFKTADTLADEVEE